MRKFSGIARVYAGMLIVTIVFIIEGASMEGLSNKLLPLMIAIPVAALAVGGLLREVFANDKAERTAEGTDETKAPPLMRRYLVTAGWLIGFFVAIYLVGFLIASLLFVLSYMRIHGISWRVVAISTVLTPVIIWAVFSYALKFFLPQGLLLEMLGIVIYY